MLVRPGSGRPIESIRLAPHDDGLAHRQRFEALQIVRQAPRQLIAAADDAVLCHRNDDVRRSCTVRALQ